MKVLRAVKVMLDRGQSIGEVSALGRGALLRLDLGPSVERRAEIPPSELTDGLTQAKERLIHSLQRLDAEDVRRLVQKLFSDLDFETLRHFALEVSLEVGNLWAVGHLSVASEHLLSSVWKEQLLLRTQDYLSGPAGEKTVICAGFPDEQHELGLLFLNCELARAQHRVVYLGPALPLEDLDVAVARLQPHVTCLSVTRTAVLRVHLPRFQETVKRHPSTTFVVGGAGVAGLEDDLIQTGALAWPSDRPLRGAAENLFL